MTTMLSARTPPFSETDGRVRARGLLLGGKAVARTTHAMPSAEATPDFNPDVELELAAVVDEVDLLRDAPTMKRSRVAFSMKLIQSVPCFRIWVVVQFDS